LPAGSFGAKGIPDPTENEDKHLEIRRRAYANWLDEGKIHGRDLEHWREAELEIAREALLAAKLAKTKNESP
jgi:hypothetical protein